MQKIKVENNIFGGGIWIVAWLFTVGFLSLSFWQGVMAILVWPYFLGTAIGSIVF